jgi:tetratricopeptide (TPR) repeat protein
MKKKLQPISPEEIAELSELRDNLINMPLEQAEKAALRMQHIIKTRSFAKDIKIYTSTLFVLAEYSARNGKYEQSTDIFKQLLSLAESHKLPDDKLRAKANLAIIQAQTGHLREALEVWEEILQMEEDPVRRINLINNICMAYGCLEDYESAIKYGYQVLDIADENNLEKMKSISFDQSGHGIPLYGRPQESADPLGTKLAPDQKVRLEESTLQCNEQHFFSLQFPP